MPAAPLRSLFRRAPREQVQPILERAMAILAEGKTIMEVQGRGGQMSQKAFPMPVADVIAECNYRLDRLDGLAKRKTYSFMATDALCNL